MMKHLRLRLVATTLLAAGMALLGVNAAVAAVTVYVNAGSLTCSDAGPGTPAAPYCSISAALAAHHAPGDSIVVLPGLYREQVTAPASGVSGSPITLAARATPGHPVVLSGADDFSNPALWTQFSGSVWRAASVTWNPAQVLADSVRLTPFTGAPEALPPLGFVWQQGSGLYVNMGGGNPAVYVPEVGHRLYGFQIAGAQWYVIDGFTVTRSEWAGFKLTGATSNITVTRDSVTTAYRYGIQADGCSAVLIAANVTSDNQASGIALTAGATGCTVQDNESYGNVTPGLSAGIYAFGAPGNLIQRNDVHDNAYNGIFMSTGSGNNVLLQNRAWKNDHHGIEDLFCTGNFHVGDVAYGNGWNGFALEGGATGTTLYDCIAVENGRISGSADLEVDSVSTAGFTSNDNVFWNPDSRPPVRFGKANYATLTAFGAATGQDTRSVQKNPRFADPERGDLRLTFGSPAIDNANSGVPNWPATDASGGSRLDDPATPNTGLGPVAYADRGALEYVPSALPPPHTVYVDINSPYCSDAGQGTPAAPFCTISGALAVHSDPGDSIIVLPGTYYEQVNASGSGLPGGPVTLVARGQPGNPVLIDGAEDFSGPSLWTPVAGNVWLAAGVPWSPAQVFADGARLTPFTGAPAALPARSFVWQSGAGLYVNAGGGNPGTHRAAVGHRQYGFRLSGAQWFVIDGFTVAHSEWAGIELTGGASNVTVMHDSVTFAYRYGIQADGASSVVIGSNVVSDNLSSGIALTAGATGCTVQDNESFRNTTPTLSAGIYCYQAPGNLFQRNRLHDNAYSGLHLQLGANMISIQNRSWNNGADGFHDVGNTATTHVGDVAYGNFRDGFRLDGGGTGTSLNNCIATVNGLIGGGFDLLVDSTATVGFASNDNLFWNPSGRPPVRYFATTYATLAEFSAATGQDTRSLQSDPRFVNPDAGDLRLTFGSPAIDNANSGVANWPPTDATGGVRLDDPSSPNTGLGPVAFADRGALEYVPIGPPPVAAVPRLDHVMIVVMENVAYDSARTAPYVAGLVAGGASFSNFYATTHPSQPNYFAMWSGSTQGLSSDDCPPPGSPYSGENLGHTLEGAGLTWRSYAENLPAVGSTECDASPDPNGALYTRKHSPWASFTNLNHANEKPYSQLAADIAADSLPNLAFVTPNNCHNAHNLGCGVDSMNAWLAREMPALIASVGPRGVVVLTWDEDDNLVGNRILTVFSSPLVRPGMVSHRFVNHYSLLRTVCEAFGVPPFGAAASESPITDVWSQPSDGVPSPPKPGTRVASAGLGRPNPFRAATSFTLTLPSPTAVSAEVFDLAGRRVKTMGTATLSGASEIRWDGSRDDGGAARPGVYLVRVRASGEVFTRRVVRLQ